MRKCAVLLLLVSCCSSSASDAPPPAEAASPGVYFEPKPFGQVGLNEWGIATAGLPSGDGFDLLDLLSLDGNVYLLGGKYKSPVGGLFTFDRDLGAWTKRASNEGGGPLAAGPDGKVYNANGKELRRFTVGTSAWEALAPAPSGIGLFVGNKQGLPTKLVSVDETFASIAYDIPTNSWSAYAPPGGALDPSKLSRATSAAVDASGNLYVGTPWSIRDSAGVLGATYRYSGGVWQDATFNLRKTNDAGLPTFMLNQTGNGWGPFGGVAVGPGTGADIYASSEQGVFRLPAGTDAWEQINAYSGNAGLSSSPAYLFASTGQVDLFESATRRRPLGQLRLFGCSEEHFAKLTSPDPALVVAFVHASGCAEGKPDVDSVVALRIDPNSPVIDRDLHLDFATYTGGPGKDEAIAAEWEEGDVLLSASNVAGEGRLLRTGADGTSRGSKVLPFAATDMAANANAIVVTGRTGVVAYPHDLGTETFRLPFDDSDSRVALAADGTIAVLAGHRMMVLSATGAVMADKTLDRAFVTDIAIDADSVYVVGFDNQRNGEPVQIPFLLAHARSDLGQRWKTWGYDPSTVGNDMADSRLYRIALGPDGAVYVLGEFAGGNTVFRWNGQDLASTTLVSSDLYNQATNTKDEHKVYYARVNRESGLVERGQMAIPRLPDGKGNTFRAGSLAVDEQGRVHIGGTTASAMAARDINLVNGAPVSPYAGGDMSILIVSPDFRTRLRWTTLSKNAGGGFVEAIAVSQGRVAALTTAQKGLLFVTDTTAPTGDDDVHLAIWRE